MTPPLEELERWLADPDRPGPFVEDVIGLRTAAGMTPAEQCRILVLRHMALLATLADTAQKLVG